MASKGEVAAGAAGAVLLIGAVVLLRHFLVDDAGKAASALPPPPDDETAFARKVADALLLEKGLHPADVAAAGDAEAGSVNRHRHYFLYRRALGLGRADPSLTTASRLPALQARVGKEYDIVDKFVKALVGTSTHRGPYFGGPYDLTHPQSWAPHIDLGDVIHVRDIDPLGTRERMAVDQPSSNPASVVALRELDVRRSRVIAIVWRAAAIEASLWSSSGDTPVLNEAALTTLLDRRLRTIELLQYEVCAGATPSGMGSSFIEGRTWKGIIENLPSPTEGPWKDGYSARVFEAPSLPRTAKSKDGTWDQDPLIAAWAKSVQLVRLDGDPTGGTFTLEVDGDVTAPIAFDATKDGVKDALLDLHLRRTLVSTLNGPLPDPVTVTLEGALPPGLEITVNQNRLTGGSSPAPVIDDATREPELEVSEEGRYGVGGSAHGHWFRNYGADELDWNEWPGTRIAGPHWIRVTDGDRSPGYGWVLVTREETQTLTVVGSPTGGTFTLSFDDHETSDIAFNATAAEVRLAMAVLPRGATDYECSGGPLPNADVTITLKNPDGTTAQFVPGTDNLIGTDVGATVSARTTPPKQPDSPADIVRKLLSPEFQQDNNTVTRADWWSRSWLHSDGALSAVHLDALRLALARQVSFNSDGEFNGVSAIYDLALDDYFHMRRVDWAKKGIMMPGTTEWFENGSIPLDDLQPGDQVLFDLNPALVAAGATAWDYPTVLVTDVGYALGKPTTSLTNVSMIGFGTTEHRYPSFQLLLTKMADAVLQGMQSFIPLEIDRQRAATPQGQTFVPPTRLPWDIGMYTDFDVQANDHWILRQWNPYDDPWDDPGPWWLWVNPRSALWSRVFGDDPLALLDQLPGALAWVDDETVQFSKRPHVAPWRTARDEKSIEIGPGFRQPPWQDNVHQTALKHEVIFVPLFQPYGGWESYFAAKTKNSADWASKLEPVRADTDWRPTLAVDPNDDKKIRVIRPRPKP